MIVKSVQKLYKWYVTLTLIASTVSVCVHLRKNDFKNKIGDLISNNIFSLLGRTLRPQNLIEGGYLRWKIEKEM